eukprot:3697834-Prymnesium_polylepis.2
MPSSRSCRSQIVSSHRGACDAARRQPAWGQRPSHATQLQVPLCRLVGLAHRQYTAAKGEQIDCATPHERDLHDDETDANRKPERGVPGEGGGVGPQRSGVRRGRW